MKVASVLLAIVFCLVTPLMMPSGTHGSSEHELKACVVDASEIVAPEMIYVSVPSLDVMQAGEMVHKTEYIYKHPEVTENCRERVTRAETKSGDIVDENRQNHFNLLSDSGFRLYHMLC